MSKKTLIQFRSEQFVLTGTWDTPDAESENMPAVIFCHGFTGNRFETRRLYVRLAERLAEAGIASFRFDHRGCGESSGDFIDFTPKGLLADLDAGLDIFLSRGNIDRTRLAVVGYSLGGASATYLTMRHPTFRTAALWAAVARPEIIRDRLATYPNFSRYLEDGFFDYGGFRVSRDYVDGVASALKPLDWISGFPQPILMVQGDSDPIVRPEQMEQYREVRRTKPCEDQFVSISGADHGFTTAQNGDHVVTITSEWLQKHLLEQ